MIAAELGLTHNQAAALTQLNCAIDDAVNTGRTPRIIPCLLNPEGWFPDGSPTIARQAVEWCEACPVLNECRAYAATAPFDDHSSVVLGGQWWSRGKLLNPYPARKHREPRPCTQCGQDHRDRHRLCRPCRYQRQKTKEIAA